MHFVILGAGALGSILAAHLLRAGHEVELIARGRRAAQLAQSGLRLGGLVQARLACKPRTAAQVRGDPDVLVLTCKTQHMAQALADVGHLSPRTVFSVANGVLKDEQLAACFGPRPVLGCMANTSGELLADGEVLFTRNECLHLGALPGQPPEPAAMLARQLTEAGINAAAEPDILNVEWTKFVGWVGYMALAVLTRLPTGQYVADAGTARIMVRIVKEMVALAAAEGIDVDNAPLMPARDIAAADEATAVAMVRAIGEDMGRRAPEHRMSALQDVLAGRPLEVEGTLGDALARAARRGLAMPTLAMCYELVGAVDRAARR